MRALLLLILCSSAAAAAPGAVRSEFEEANRLYEEARFEEAASRYEGLAARLPGSANLHFNMGNAYFRQKRPGSLGRAIAAYHRAFKLRPRDPDIRYNLDFALRRVGEALIPSGTPPALFILFHILSGAELAALHWLGFWAAMLLGALFLSREALRGRLRPWLLGAVAFWALSGGWWGARSLTGVPSLAITVSHCEARSGPGVNFPVSFKVPEGRRVSRLDAKGEWVEIGVLKEGLKGWISRENVDAI